jgi:GT2 family glycosyltransferase
LFYHFDNPALREKFEDPWKSESKPLPEISIVVVSYNTKEMTRKCLETINKYGKNVSYEIIVVDNASYDGSANMIACDFPEVRLIRLNTNKGFSGGNNEGIKKASGKYILLLNSDAFIEEGSLEKAVCYMKENPTVGIMGCKLTNPDGSLQPSARMLPSILNKALHISGLAFRFQKSKFFGRVDFSWWDHSSPREVGWVVGAFYMIRKETLQSIGLLDERYFLYFEEIDYCRAASKAGWKVVMNPDIRVVHLGGQSSNGTNQMISAKGKQLIKIRLISEFRYWRKYHGLFHVGLTSGMEFFWNLLVLFKNCFAISNHAKAKVQESKVMLSLIPKVLQEDHFGKCGEV